MTGGQRGRLVPAVGVLLGWDRGRPAATSLSDRIPMSIMDAHCHAWRRWPYDTGVPDPDTRGSVSALLYEMDTHGVEHAAVVCARIGGGAGGDGFANPDNNDHVVDAARRHPDRLTAWIDVDSCWSPEHHTPGAADRLRVALERTGARGFTHYVEAENDGWLRGEEGAAFFAVAAEAGVVASLALGPAWLADLAGIAAAHPTLPILIHHMATPGPGSPPVDPADLLALAAHPGVGVKVSGFHYNTAIPWGFPYEDAAARFAMIGAAFGAERLYWGSDFPASRDLLTYRQSIETVRSVVALSDTDRAAVLGGNLARLLRRVGG